MVNCAVYGCSNHSKNGRNDKNVRQIGFLSIPKLKLNECPKTAELSLKRRALWLQRIHRADLDVTANHYRICGDHFLTGTSGAKTEHAQNQQLDRPSSLESWKHKTQTWCRSLQCLHAFSHLCDNDNFAMADNFHLRRMNKATRQVVMRL
ncbi:hypothetical protein HPB48_001178 [Haemaphysalis longicornis]|uniref:THAP-type domain-containing protein n=1 Tax=Haemaphysalis longicornis TaxID=44386 RepID=A0A9J6FI84_HAELO|nr:hypothetical protein HPB48_001178 [Haemaphysalis longicornis]